MVTIQQIARETGFSASTVSIVLNNKGEERNISEATQQAILEAAARMNYRPSISARALRTGEGISKLVALYFGADYRTAMMNRFTNGLWAYPPCQSPEVKVVISPYRVGELSKDRQLRSFRQYHGVILCNMNAGDMEYLRRNRPGMPAVLYNRVLEGYSSVTVENWLLGEKPAQVFADTGCKKAAVVSLESPFPGMDERVRAFALYCLEHGVEVLPPVQCESSRKGGYQAVQAMLQQGADFDCLFCTADILAYGALRALLEAGISVPEQVQVIAIGNDDPEQAVYTWPSLSQVQVPIEAMAQECFRLVSQQIENRMQEPTQLRLPVRYIPRESTRPLPGEA